MENLHTQLTAVNRYTTFIKTINFFCGLLSIFVTGLIKAYILISIDFVGFCLLCSLNFKLFQVLANLTFNKKYVKLEKEALDSITDLLGKLK